MKYSHKNTTRFIFSMILFIIFFCSCSKENDIDINYEQETENLSFQSQTLPNINLTEKEAIYVSSLFLEKDFFKEKKLSTRSSTKEQIKNIIPIQSDNGITLAYIINYNGGGYQIISAIKKYTPIIAFSENGYIPEDYNKIDGFSFWISCLKKDILDKIKTNDSETDSLYIENRLLWREYERSKIENRSISNDQKDHRYWYGKMRTQFMTTSDVITFMSRDLDGYNKRIQNAYDIRGNNIISDSEKEYLRKVDVALKADYKKNNLWEPDSYFWMEYNKGYVKHNIELLNTFWKQSRPYNIYNPKRNKPDPLNPKDDHQPLGCVTIAVAQIMKYHNHPNTIVYFDKAKPKYLSMDWNKLEISSVNPDDNIPNELPTFLRAVNIGVGTENGDNGSSSNIGKARKFLEVNRYSVTEHNAFYRDIVRSELLSGNPVYVRGDNMNGGSGHAFVCDGIRNLEKKLSIELYYTYETSVKSYNQNPYIKMTDASGNKTINEEFFNINWGWGYSTEVNSKTLEFNAYTKDVKILTIRKK